MSASHGLSQISVGHVNRFWDRLRTEAERLRLEVLLERLCLEAKGERRMTMGRGLGSRTAIPLL